MVLVFGTVCIDRIRRVPYLPSPGGYVEVEDESMFLGGEAANTANALSTWGHPISLAGNGLGTGTASELLWDMLVAKGLPTECFKNPSRAGGLDSEPGAQELAPVCDIYVTPDGERTMFGRGFAQANIGVHLDQIPFSECAWFTAEPNMGDRAREVVRVAAQKNGSRSGTNSAPNVYLMDFIRADDPIYPGSFWQSSTDLAGHRNNTQRNVQWVKDWVERWSCHTILSDGPNGFVFGGPDHPVRAYPPFPAPVVVDTTGAGDVFRAGMLHGLDSQWSIPETLRFAAAAGCLKCRALGATTDIPTEREIRDLIAANPHVAAAYG